MAQNITPLVNGKAHDWASIEINILGTPIAGVKGIKYSETREKVDNYGIGSVPVSRGYGQRKATASITLYAEEVAALEELAENGDITMIPPFDVAILFIPEGSSAIAQHVIKNFEFKKNSRDAKSGDTALEVELEGICSHIEWRK